MGAMIEGHRHAIAAFESESAEQAQTAVDKWAGHTVATLQEHLRMAESTGKEVGARRAARPPSGKGGY
jgi:hypothetical protein